MNLNMMSKLSIHFILISYVNVRTMDSNVIPAAYASLLNEIKIAELLNYNEFSVQYVQIPHKILNALNYLNRIFPAIKPLNFVCITRVNFRSYSN